VSSMRTEAEAAKLVQQWVNYAMNLGLLNEGPEFLLKSAAELAVDLCSYNDMFEYVEPEEIQPYVAVWREMKIAEADIKTAAGEVKVDA
jgi:hypothetical protein